MNMSCYYSNSPVVKRGSSFNCIEITDARKPQALEGTAKYKL